MTTARMTKHARQRCTEMGISTKVAKRIVAHGEVRYDSLCRDGNLGTVVRWSGDQTYAAVVARDDPYLVLTVIFNTREQYVRNGTTHIIEQVA